MNKLKVLFAIMVITGLSNCGNGAKNDPYNALGQTLDSLKKRNTKLLTVYDTLNRAHEQLMQRLDELDSLDSAWLDKMDQHELTKEKHLDVFKKHEIVFSKDNELIKENDKNSSEVQVIAMKKRFVEIGHELDKIAREQESIGADHRSIEDELPQE